MLCKQGRIKDRQCAGEAKPICRLWMYNNIFRGLHLRQFFVHTTLV